MATRTVLSIAVGSAIAVAGLVGGSIVMASSDTGETAITIASTGGGLDQAQGDAFLTALAARLNVSVDALKAAIKDTGLEFLDKALADGKITQDMHDKIKSAIESGKIEGFGLGRGFGIIGEHGKGMPNGMPFGKGPGGRRGGDVFGQLMKTGDNLAKFLGLADAAALRTEMQGGKSLADIAAGKGIPKDALKGELKAEAGALLDEAVKSGKLTQAQADVMKTGFESQLDDMISMKMGSMGPGSHMGPRGMGPFKNILPGSGTGGSTTNSQ